MKSTLYSQEKSLCYSSSTWLSKNFYGLGPLSIFTNQENKEIGSSFLPPASPLMTFSSLARNCMHHVFPSFHGDDVRKAFLSHILKELRSKGIDTFIDNDIERSKSIGHVLVEAIRGSRIAVVLLSKNYASSTWCLNELVEIMRCREKSGQNQIVMSIFYEVDPTDVKKQTGNLGKVFTKTCKGKTKEEIKRWRNALKGVAKIAGEHSRNWDCEATMIEKIAIDISNKLNKSNPSSDFNDLVGMKTHMEKMGPLLRLDLDEVRMIGIWGPPGIGKTTIARFLFNRYLENFQLSVFMENIKAMYTTPICSDDYYVKLQLQQKFPSRIINQKDIKICHLGIAQERLRNKKVLVVLDDINHLVQLDAMAKETRWFGDGSRIIITTQDIKVLKAHGIKHIYKVDFPSVYEALQMFCRYAFGQNSPKYGFERLAWEVTVLVGNLPLGLRVMGSYFRRMSKQEWKKELLRLRTRLDGEIENILKFSYDVLSDENKDLFLHIACFFNNQRVEKVVEHLAVSFLDVRQGLHLLAEKSLISIDGGYIEMHNLLAQLGKEIVRKQSIHEPRLRHFLFDAQDIGEVLTDYTLGRRRVIGIDFNFDKAKAKSYISERAFEGMSNLKFLRLFGYLNTLDLPHGIDCLPHKIRLLDWIHFPMVCLPSNVNLEFLVELNMRHSKLEKLWEGIKPLSNLRWMDLRHSKYLKELPDLSTATNLQILNLRVCSSLLELPSSIGNATNLVKLILRGCSSLMKLPSSIGKVTSLIKLNLSECSSLMEFSFSIGNATNLQILNLSECSSLVKFNNSMENATNTNLKILNLSCCSRLVKLPSSIGNSTNLEILKIGGCSRLVELPFSIGNAMMNIDELYFSGCSSLVEIPSSIGNAINLTYLDFSGCSNLVELPACIGNLQKLYSLILKGCSKLQVLPTNIELKMLNSLELTDCSSLKSFPEISTRINYLDLSGTAIKEVPSSIKSWSRLEWLQMSYSENLKEFPHALDRITDLHLSDTKIQVLEPWVKGLSRLRQLVLKGCKELLSLPQLPDSLSELDAENCESLERLDCSFLNPYISLNFANCFKLNKEARDLIIQTSTNQVAVLPGEEVPTYFTYRANGGSLIVKLNERPSHSSSIFKACISLISKNDVEGDNGQMVHVYHGVVDKQNSLDVRCSPSNHILSPPLTKHLYTFEFDANVTSNELLFEFQVDSDKCDIKESGVHCVNNNKRIRLPQTLRPTFMLMDTNRAGG